MTRRTWRVVQVVTAAWAYLAYVAAFSAVHPSTSLALHAGRAVVLAERWLGFDRVENLLRHLHFGAVGTLLYVGLHFALTPSVAVWLIFRRPALWRRARWSLLLLGLVALVVFALLPVAPPWALGAADGTPWAHGTGAGAGVDLMAAFPSLHVACAVWVARALRASGARRWVTSGYPLLVSVVVVATGNHYLLDVVGGWLLAVAASGAVDLLRHRKGVNEQWPLTPQPLALSRPPLAGSRTR